MDKRSFSQGAAPLPLDALPERLLQAPPPPDPLPQAAVLVPIVMRAVPMVLFTLRSESLARHPGQISFPGGLAETGETDPAATALREMEEETGIAPEFVAVAGYLPAYCTASGFCVRPVVGRLREGFRLKPDPCEVAGIIEAPLAFFLDPGRMSEIDAEWLGEVHRVKLFEYGDCRIWGVTAAIMAELAQRLRP